jgi:ubiquinone/menaquinone biosynthesis C-methylase UbiE
MIEIFSVLNGVEIDLMAGNVCPWWVGYLLMSPLRRWAQNPKHILSPYVKPGMIALDVGCGMGFFSLDMARLVGSDGKAICVDLQSRMIQSLIRRAEKAGVLNRIVHRVCSEDSLGIEDFIGQIDFVLAFAVVHEVPDAFAFFHQIYKVLKSEGVFLCAEPRGHVSEKSFRETESTAQRAGFKTIDRPLIKRSRAVLLKR